MVDKQTTSDGSSNMTSLSPGITPTRLRQIAFAAFNLEKAKYLLVCLSVQYILTEKVAQKRRQLRVVPPPT